MGCLYTYNNGKFVYALEHMYALLILAFSYRLVVFQILLLFLTLMYISITYLIATNTLLVTHTKTHYDNVVGVYAI